jgi:hypothetical protein
MIMSCSSDIEPPSPLHIARRSVPLAGDAHSLGQVSTKQPTARLVGEPSFSPGDFSKAKEVSPSNLAGLGIAGARPSPSAPGKAIL